VARRLQAKVPAFFLSPASPARQPAVQFLQHEPSARLPSRLLQLVGVLSKKDFQKAAGSGSTLVKVGCWR